MCRNSIVNAADLVNSKPRVSIRQLQNRVNAAQIASHAIWTKEVGVVRACGRDQPESGLSGQVRVSASAVYAGRMCPNMGR